MDKNPSGLPSSGGGKDKGIAIEGGSPYYSSNSSHRNSSDSERTLSTDSEEFQSPNSLGQEVGSYRVNHQGIDSKTNSAQFKVSLRKNPNFGVSGHFSEVDSQSQMSPGKRQKGGDLQTEDTDSEINSGQFEVRFRKKKPNTWSSSHFSEVDSQMRLEKRQKGANIRPKDATIVRKEKINKKESDIPDLWKVHPRKDEVDPDGWMVEVTPRPGRNAKDKYYRHKDYNYRFRSKRAVKLFLDTGTVLVNKAPHILQKRSADPNGHVRGRGRPRTGILALNSGSGTSTSGGKAPVTYKLPPGFV